MWQPRGRPRQCAPPDLAALLGVLLKHSSARHTCLKRRCLSIFLFLPFACQHLFVNRDLAIERFCAILWDIWDTKIPHLGMSISI